MRLLLTSAGIKNTSIHDALVDLLGKPIAESDALCIPTAGYGHPMSSPAGAWRFISGQEPGIPMCGLGWKSLGVLKASLRFPASAKNAGCPGSGRRTCCWWVAATPSTCAIGCASPGWQISCRRCAKWSGWG